MTVHQAVKAYDVVDMEFDGHTASQGPGRVVKALWRYRLWIALGLLGGLGLGIVALRMLPASYKSEVSILLDPKRADIIGANEAFANIAVDSGKVADVEQILISSELLGKVVLAERLADDPRFSGSSNSFLRRALNQLTGQGRTQADTAALRMGRAVDKLSKMIRTARVGLTYVITVTVTAPSQLEAQRLAAAVAEAYIAEQVATKYADARADAAWLEERLNHLRPELVGSEARVLAIRHRYGLFQSGNTPGSTMNRQRLTELTSELARAQGDAAQVSARYAQAAHTLQAGGIPDAGNSLVLDTLRVSAAEAARHLADLSGVYGANHPTRLQAAHSLATLEARIRMEAARMTQQLREQDIAAREQVASLQSLLRTAVQDETVADNVDGRATLNEAERIAEVNRTTYEAALARLHDVEQQETRQKAEARIISPAPFPEHSSFPRPIVCLPLGGAFGMLIGIGFALMRGFVGGSVDDPDLAESQLHLPVLGVVPRLTRRELGPAQTSGAILQYLHQNPYSAYAESLRRLRLSIRSSAGAGAKVVQFTSALPADGKSTLAASMALTAAMAGLRTALVDLDMHNPSAQATVQSIYPPAVIDPHALSGPYQSVVMRHPDLPLHVITLGAPGRAAMSLLEEAFLRRTIAELRSQFDLVLLDTPPVLALSDALLAAQFADATILVCAVHATPRAQAIRATAALRTAGASVCGLVLNKARFTTASYGYPGAPGRPRQIERLVESATGTPA